MANCYHVTVFGDKKLVGQLAFLCESVSNPSLGSGEGETWGISKQRFSLFHLALFIMNIVWIAYTQRVHKGKIKNEAGGNVLLLVQPQYDILTATVDPTWLRKRNPMAKGRSETTSWPPRPPAVSLGARPRAAVSHQKTCMGLEGTGGALRGCNVATATTPPCWRSGWHQMATLFVPAARPIFHGFLQVSDMQCFTKCLFNKNICFFK